MVDPVRWSVLTIFVLSLAILSMEGYLERADEHWKKVRPALRIIVSAVVGWPLAAIFGPILIEMWNNATSEITGLGGEATISDFQTQLLVLLIAATGVQTAVLVVKLNRLQEEL